MSTENSLTVISPAPLPLAAFNPSEEQVNLLKRTICQNSSDDEFDMFLMVCKRTGLDPFAKQIHAVKRWDNNTGVNKMAIQTGIDGFRLIAERTRKYEGQTAPQWCGKDGVWREVWTATETPFAARVGIHKTGFREPCWGIAHFEEYAQTKKGGELVHMWKQMPRNQIAKCAEALGLRKAFPQELSGLYTDDEMTTDDQPREPYKPQGTQQAALPNPETMFEPDPEVTEANWCEIVNTGTKTESRRKPIGELPRPYVEWFLSLEPEHAGKGMVDFWKKNPAAFGPAERKVWTAMTFALAAHTARKAAEAAGETPAADKEAKAPASKDAWPMLVKMIKKSGCGTSEIMKAAYELQITADYTDEPTDAACMEIISRFADVTEYLEGDSK